MFRSVIRNRRLRADASSIRPCVSEEDARRYRDEGYVVFENLLSSEEVHAIRSRVHELAERRIRTPRGVKFEYEPGCEDRSPSALRQIWDTIPSDPELTRILAFHPALVGTVKGLLGNDVKLFRDCVMLKRAGVGSPKPLHQDSAYWPIEPHELVSAWVALDDADPTNGCLTVLPGSHKQGLRPFSKDDHSVHRPLDSGEFEDGKQRALAVQKGAVVLFHSLLAHASGPNRSEMDRFAYILSYMSAGSSYVGAGRSPRFFTICGRGHKGKV